MDVTVRASIDIYGTVLRYAEVGRRGTRYTLLRLGSCEFDFDVADALLQTRRAEDIEALTDALNDVFDGSEAARLYVMLHPPLGYAFFSPLPLDLTKGERKQRLLQEAASLTRSSAPQPLRLTADPVYTETLDDGQAVEWFHVLALQERLHTRFDRIFRVLPHSHHRMTMSMHAVANAVEQIERREAEATPARAAPFTLAVGWYPTHIEYTLCREGRWYFSHFTDASPPEDSAYFALLLLDRLGIRPASMGRVFVYGVRRDLDAFAYLSGVFPVAPELLNPIALMDLDRISFGNGLDLEAYAPCIGVTL